MQRFRFLTAALALATALVAVPAAAIPDVVSYAARVENDAGPFDGTAAVTFRIFGAATGGTALWTENVASAVVVNGDLVHELGSVAPLDDALLDSDALFLELTFNGETLTPRVAINAAPFALRAREAEVAEIAIDAEQLGGRAAATYQFTAASGGGLTLSGTSFSIATGGVNATHIADGTVGAAELANSAVSSAKLAAAAVTTAILADFAVATAKLADGAVTLAKLAANSVDGTKIVDGSVGNAEIATGAINAAKLAASSVTSVAINDGAVAAADLATAAVTESKIAAGAVTAAKLRSGVALFELPPACGTGLTIRSSCSTIACNEQVTRDAFNTILDVDVEFRDCANNCNRTSPAVCSVSATPVGTMVGP
jgi:hypothetical protein